MFWAATRRRLCAQRSTDGLQRQDTAGRSRPRDRVGGLGQEVGQERLGLLDRLVHLPVGGEEQSASRSGILQRLHSGQVAALQQLQRGAAAGRDPVDRVGQAELAAGRRPSPRRRPRCGPARPRPPRRRRGCRRRTAATSKAPIGPFQKTVPARAIRLAKLAVVLAPTSRPIQPSGTSTPFSSRRLGVRRRAPCRGRGPPAARGSSRCPRPRPARAWPTRRPPPRPASSRCRVPLP